MVRKGFKPEQIIGKLREAEVLLSQGSTVGEASRKLGVTGQKKKARIRFSSVIAIGENELSLLLLGSAPSNPFVNSPMDRVRQQPLSY